MSEGRIVCLCTGNSIRSQMCEAYFKHFLSKDVGVESAGIQASFVHPLTIQVLAEDGIDWQTAHSKSLRELEPVGPKDTLITLCDYAVSQVPKACEEAGQHIHWSTPDPMGLMGDLLRLENFRKVRDSIRGRVLTYIKDTHQKRSPRIS